MNIFNLKTIAVFPLSLLLFGCAQNVWFKQNAENGAFEKDKYDCLQQSQQRNGFAQANAYGGFATNTVNTNNGLFASCMNGRGWSWQNKEATQVQITQLNINQASLQKRFEQLKENSLMVCKSPELIEYYNKSACQAPDINFSQIADATKITETQKIALLKQRNAVDSTFKAYFELYKEAGAAGLKSNHISVNFTQPENNKNNLDLYNEKITWGEYNKRRKDIYIETQNKFR